VVSHHLRYGKGKRKKEEKKAEKRSLPSSSASGKERETLPHALGQVPGGRKKGKRRGREADTKLLELSAVRELEERKKKGKRKKTGFSFGELLFHGVPD